MAISYIGSGTTSAVVTDFTINWPVGSVAAGRLAIIAVIKKDFTDATTVATAGWTELLTFANGSVANAADAGSVRIKIFYKILDGSESGSVSLTHTANTGFATLSIWANGTGTWDLASATSSAGSNSATASSDPGLSAGDELFVALGQKGDLGGSPNTPVAAATGATFGAATTIRSTNTNTGFDCAYLASTHPVTAGPSSAAPSYSWTAGMADGAAAFVRLRESSGGAGNPHYYYRQL